MLLIREITEDIETDTVIEESTGKKSYYLKGITIQANIKNKNNRFYPLDIVVPVVEKHNSEYVNEYRSYGELDHPDTPRVSMKNVSHRFMELKLDGENVISKAKVNDSPNGQIVKHFIDEKYKLGISSRALGTLKQKDGVNIVQEDLFLISPGDIVSDPSAPNAFVQGIKEGVEYGFIDGKIVEFTKNQIDQHWKQTMSKTEKTQLLLRLFKEITTWVN